VRIRFVIKASGVVKSSVVASSSMDNPAVEQCVARVISSIGFPARDRGGMVVVTYPFTFELQLGEGPFTNPSHSPAPSRYDH
jgi:TonB family protein